jgi:hypothetical protein
MIKLRRNLNLGGFRESGVRKQVLMPEDVIIEKARKDPIGTINLKHKRIKIADVKGDFKASWMYIKSEKQKKEVIAAHGGNDNVFNALGAYDVNHVYNEDEPAILHPPGYDPDTVRKPAKPTKRPTGGGGTSPEPAPSRPMKRVQSADDLVSNILNGNYTNQQKFDIFYGLGVVNPDDLAAISQLDYLDVLARLEKVKKPDKTPEQLEQIHLEIERIRVEDEKELAENTRPKKRFQNYVSSMSKVMRGKIRGALGYGAGGIGKSFLMEEEFKMHIVNHHTGEIIHKTEATLRGIEWQPSHYEHTPDVSKPWRDLIEFDPHRHVPGENTYDYVIKGGKTTPGGGYITLYEHNDKIIVFDDMEGIMDNDVMLAFLKVSMDTKPKDVEYASTNQFNTRPIVGEPEPVPRSLKFTGRMIIITNMERKELYNKKNKHRMAVMTRFTPTDLTMNRSQTMELLRDLKDTMVVRDGVGNVMFTPQNVRDDVMAFYEKHRDRMEIDFMNGRVFGRLAEAHMASENMADFRLTAQGLTGLLITTGDIND